jgi:hypothetical protein
MSHDEQEVCANESESTGADGNTADWRFAL